MQEFLYNFIRALSFIGIEIMILTKLFCICPVQYCKCFHNCTKLLLILGQISSKLATWTWYGIYIHIYIYYRVASKRLCRESAKNIFRLIQNRDINTRCLKGTVALTEFKRKKVLPRICEWFRSHLDLLISKC